MHELSLSNAIVSTAVAHARGRRVTAVNVLVGNMRQVVPESLEFYFDLVARETPCEGAVLQQTVLPARLRCRACGLEWELEVLDFRCPGCGDADFEVMSGAELEVESIEIEEEEPCIEPG
jgi:hydrogenase nickel incorporation protein HypA/HybF